MAITSTQVLRVCSERDNVSASKYGFTNTVQSLNDRIREINLVSDNINFVWSEKEHYGVSRFSDGTWPVLYTAEDELTAMTEVFHHLMEAKKTAGNVDESASWSQLIFSMTFTGKCAEIKIPPTNVDVLHPSKEQYNIGYDLAKTKRLEGYDALKIPSARKIGGTCYPIFTESAANINSGVQSTASLHWDAEERTASIEINGQAFTLSIDDVHGQMIAS